MDDRAVGGDEERHREGNGADAVGEFGEVVAQQLVLHAAVTGKRCIFSTESMVFTPMKRTSSRSASTSAKAGSSFAHGGRC